MKIEIRATSIELSKTLRDYVRRRVRSVLGRFSPSIDRVRVTLAYWHGPRGGLDRRCTVQVYQAGVEPVVAEHTHEHVHGAIVHAVRRAERAMARRRDRAAWSGTWGRREALYQAA